jgi:hypothetical protein
MVTEVMMLYENAFCPIATTVSQVFEMLEKRELGTVNDPAGAIKSA